MERVCIIFGGASSEHEVSLRSATSVLQNIDRTAYSVEMVGITKAGRWLHYTGPVDAIVDGRWETQGPVCPAVLSPDPGHGGLLLLGDGGTEVLPVDVVFPVLHGKNGEDGTIQGLLELCGIPYVGSGVLGSSVCMDKEVAHLLLQAAGVPKTKLVAVRTEDIEDMQGLEQRLSQELGYPMFVKPANAGSSVGVSKVKQAAQLLPALQLALAHDHKAVVEQAVVGQEVECAVLGNRHPVASGVLGEIAPRHEFYDYEGKYLDDSTDLYIPARLSPEIVQQVRQVAVRAYQALECAGLSRVDFFVTGQGEVILNEINTLPGFTAISMYPKLFAADGVPYDQLITRLIQCAKERN